MNIYDQRDEFDTSFDEASYGFGVRPNPMSKMNTSKNMKSAPIGNSWKPTEPASSGPGIAPSNPSFEGGTPPPIDNGGPLPPIPSTNPAPGAVAGLPTGPGYVGPPTPAYNPAPPTGINPTPPPTPVPSVAPPINPAPPAFGPKKKTIGQGPKRY